MAEIGLAGLPLDFPYSGTAVYASNLVPLLPVVAPDLLFRVFVRRHRWADGGVPSQTLQIPMRQPDKQTPMWARLDKLAWETIALPVASALRRQALLHSLYFAAPVVSHAPVLVTVHDLIPLALPDYHRSWASEIYSKLMSSTVRGAPAILTVSRHSKQDIERLLRVPPHRIHVTYEAVDDRFSPETVPGEEDRISRRYALPGRFLMYVGGAEKRKNIETLVLAWHECARFMHAYETKLVIVAAFPPPDALYPDIPALVRRLGLEASILLIPRIDEHDKPALYRSALGLCFPSLYEGFGFSPLEAMASGTPVIAADATSIPEVVGSAGWLLPAMDVDAWALAMRRLVESDSERALLREAGLRQATRFSWRETAAATAGVYREVLGR